MLWPLHAGWTSGDKGPQNSPSAARKACAKPASLPAAHAPEALGARAGAQRVSVFTGRTREVGPRPKRQGRRACARQLLAFQWERKRLSVPSREGRFTALPSLPKWVLRLKLHDHIGCVIFQTSGNCWYAFCFIILIIIYQWFHQQFP